MRPADDVAALGSMPTRTFGPTAHLGMASYPPTLAQAPQHLGTALLGLAGGGSCQEGPEAPWRSHSPAHGS